MTISDTRVSSYLDDLARMLADLDPADRDEVLAGVREHLDATLADHPDDPATVDAALLRLGPPERVAAEARASATGGEHPGRRWDPGSRAWAQAGVVAVGVGTAPFVLARALSITVDRLSQGGSSIATNASVALMDFASGLAVATPVWLVGLVAVAVSPHFIRRTRVRVLAIGPVLVVGSAVALALLGASWGGAETAAVLLVAMAVYISLVCRRGWREARA